MGESLLVFRSSLFVVRSWFAICLNLGGVRGSLFIIRESFLVFRDSLVVRALRFSFSPVE